MERSPKFVKEIRLFVYRMDYCPNCNTENLEIYDYFNNPLGYKAIIDKYQAGERIQKGMINHRVFYTIRCKKCGRTYPIVWRRGYPLPDHNPLNYKTFMSEFRHCGDKK